MGVISLVWGVLALLGMLLALIPLLGALNWFVIPFAGIGAVIAVIGLLTSGEGHRSRAKAGLLLNIGVMVVGAIRLSLGGGIL